MVKFCTVDLELHLITLSIRNLIIDRNKMHYLDKMTDLQLNVNLRLFSFGDIT